MCVCGSLSTRLPVKIPTDRHNHGAPYSLCFLGVGAGLVAFYHSMGQETMIGRYILQFGFFYFVLVGLYGFLFINGGMVELLA